MLVHAVAQNEKLGGSGLEIGLGGGADVVNKEHLNRKILSIVGGERSTFDIWGVAIDVNLESEHQGKKAGPFIMVTVIAALLVVGATYKIILGYHNLWHWPRISDYMVKRPIRACRDKKRSCDRSCCSYWDDFFGR